MWTASLVFLRRSFRIIIIVFQWLFAAINTCKLSEFEWENRQKLAKERREKNVWWRSRLIVFLIYSQILGNMSLNTLDGELYNKVFVVVRTIGENLCPTIIEIENYRRLFC